GASRVKPSRSERTLTRCLYRKKMQWHTNQRWMESCMHAAMTGIPRHFLCSPKSCKLIKMTFPARSFLYINMLKNMHQAEQNRSLNPEHSIMSTLFLERIYGQRPRSVSCKRLKMC